MDLYFASTASPKFIGKAIRWFSGGDVSHSLVVYRTSDQVDNPWNVLQAQADGFHEECVDLEQAQTWVRAWRFVGDDAQGWRVLSALKKLRGVNYDFLSILRWGWAGIRNKVTHSNRFRPSRVGEGALYCSEAVAVALHRAGVPGFRSEPVTPAELDRLFDESPLVAAVDLDAMRERISAESSA